MASYDYNIGGGLSSAASGAMTGAALGGMAGGIGAVPGAFIGGIGGLLGGLQQKESGGQVGYDVVTLPQYSFTEPRLGVTSDFITSNLERLQRGEAPVYYEKRRPIIRQGLMRGLDEAYFGTPGQRTGVVQAGLETAALTGLGPRGAQAQTRKAMSDYARQAQSIDEFLANQELDIFQQAQQLYPQLSIGMPQGPQSQIVPIYT
jgi:hypothetical protein